jgi:LAO/AO transport system kinase
MAPWRPAIVETVAATGSGITQLWQTILAHRDWLGSSGGLMENRKRRAGARLDQVLALRLIEILRRLHHGETYRRVQEAVERGELDPSTAADQLLGEVGLASRE